MFQLNLPRKPQRYASHESMVARLCWFWRLRRLFFHLRCSGVAQLARSRRTLDECLLWDTSCFVVKRLSRWERWYRGAEVEAAEFQCGGLSMRTPRLVNSLCLRFPRCSSLSRSELNRFRHLGRCRTRSLSRKRSLFFLPRRECGWFLFHSQSGSGLLGTWSTSLDRLRL